MASAVVGVLYPGEMGAALAALLRDAGHRVVTTVHGRGPATRRNSRNCGLEELPSVADVLEAANIILSVVPPTAAVDVARQCRDHLPQPAAGRRWLYVDLNSVSPETARQAGAVFAGLPVDFVDGAVHGLAAQLRTRGIVFLSGAHVECAAELFRGCRRVQVLGSEPGQASALRMLLSVISKGVIALFTEAAVTAAEAGILDATIAAYDDIYPAIMEVVRRILPTYPRHAQRRADEMREVEAAMRRLGMRPTVAVGARAVIAEMGSLWTEEAAGRDWAVCDIIEDLRRRGLLRAAAQAATAQGTHPPIPCRDA